MNVVGIPVLRAAALLACCMAVVSCQTGTDPVPETTGPMVATVKFTATEDHYPDSADWSSAKQSGTGGLTCSDGVCTDTLRLRDALGAEGAQLRLWSLGIRIATLQLSQAGRSTSLTYSVSKDTFEIRVLDEFLEFKRARSDSFAKIGTVGPADLVAFYALQVLSGAPGYSGFPAVLPVGMKTDSVKRAIVALGPAFALTHTRLAGMGLGLDSVSIRVFAMELFVSGKITATDTLSLFPLHPLRVIQPLSVTTDLVPGGAAVPLSGAFSWNKGRIVSAPTITVKTSNGADPGFVSSAKNWPSSADTSWSLSDNVSISAPLGAVPGIDTLVVVLSSDSGYSVETRTTFRVVPRDVAAPTLGISRPGRDTTVPNETYSIVVEATATDSSGVDSVRIRNVTRTASPYLDTVYLAVGENLVVVQAWDKFGNVSSDTVKIFRAKPVGDTTAPKIIRISPVRDTLVPWSTKSMVLSWAVTDDSLLSRVTLGSDALSGTSGHYQVEVSLPIGKASFILTATDAKGNERRDTVRIERKSDTAGPVIGLVSPSRDTSVPYGTMRIQVVVTATDPDTGLDSVKIGGSGRLVAPFSHVVDLATGSNPILVQAWDKAGNRSERVVSVDRAASPGDTTAPVVVRIRPTKDTTVGWSVKSLALSYSIADDSLLSKVWLNDTLWTGTGSSFQKTVDLAIGTNVLRVAAQDARGNRRLDTLRIVRLADTDAPVLEFTGPSKDTSVAFNVGSIRVSAKASDANGIDSIRIGTRTFSSDAASESIALANGANEIVVQAWDKAGNRTVDTLRIVRIADIQAPTLIFAGPSKDSSVAFDVGSIQVSVKATDANGIDSVRIGSRTFASDAASESIALVTGANQIVVQAWDKAGNRAVDTLRITRLRDMVMPKIVRASGASEQVLSYLGTSPVSWTVTDNDSLVWVKIQGKIVQGSKSVYTANIPVGPGRFSIVVEAADRAGNISVDTVWWTGKLYDSRDRKSYSIATMPDGKIWMTEELAYSNGTCGSSCVDSFYTWSEAMGLPSACDDSVCTVDTTVMIKGVCPTDWHLPTAKEWQTLVDAAGIIHLKSATAWIKSSGGIVVDMNGDNLYGFNLLPRSSDCSAGGCSMAGKWWTVHQEEASQARAFRVTREEDYPVRGKWNYLSVRCLRN